MEATFLEVRKSLIQAGIAFAESDDCLTPAGHENNIEILEDFRVRVYRIGENGVEVSEIQSDPSTLGGDVLSACAGTNHLTFRPFDE